MATLIKGIKSIYEGIVSLIYPNSCPFEITHECSMKDYCSPEGWNDKVCHFCFNEFVDLNLTPRIEENGVLIHSVAEYKNEVKTVYFSHKKNFTRDVKNDKILNFDRNKIKKDRTNNHKHSRL